MADTLDVLVRAVHIRASESDRNRPQFSLSDATVNEYAVASPTIATNSTTEVGNLGAMGVTSGTNTGEKAIFVVNDATVLVNIRLNTTSSTGQHPIAAGHAYFAFTTSITGLHINNPSTTSTAAVKAYVWDL